MIIDRKSLPFVVITTRVEKTNGVTRIVETVDTTAFDAKLLAHLADRALHRFTVGVAAPFPEHEILRLCAESIERGEELELTHWDQFYHDWDAANLMNANADKPAPSTVMQSPSLWNRVVNAWQVLKG